MHEYASPPSSPRCVPPSTTLIPLRIDDCSDCPKVLQAASSSSSACSRSTESDLASSHDPESVYLGASKLIDDVVENFHSGVRKPTQPFVGVNPAVHEIFRDRLPTEHPEVNDKLRYDFDAVNELFSLRMPEPVHDEIGRGLIKLLLQRVRKAVEEYNDVVDLTDQHRDGASSTIMMGDSKSRMSPDESIKFHKECYPPFVLEIGHTQDGDTLALKADQWYEGSKCKTKTIVAITVEYWDPKKREQRMAKDKGSGFGRRCGYTVYKEEKGIDDKGPWRQLGCSGDGNDIVFSPQATIQGDEVAMVFNLADFTPSHILTSDNPGPNITITHNELRAIVAKAEEAQSIQDEEERKLKEIAKGLKRAASPTVNVRHNKRYLAVEAARESEAMIQQRGASSPSKDAGEGELDSEDGEFVPFKSKARGNP
ncbi:hypothetical protein EJ02DRAFT_459439 [Clathrospora elynae]|uniref:Uncharacterized protein n=1 Tax=Clathrospora elynae TaxID=706981 RepID=A0A6A5S7B9_9PLEO|nr:hypothetical protein EJ02DRAFT_459439 [Clathrospora elynae]